MKKIAINTGGGDAPGLNAVIKGATISALNNGWEVVGIRDGYNGIFLEENYPQGGLMNLTRERVADITPLGGTILGTTNRGNPFAYPMKNEKGEIVEIDRSDEIMEGFRENNIDALIAIGGDGSLSMANKICKKGMRVVGVPKTIDNDLDKTVITFGFDTAVSFATESIDRLHSTAQAHGRIMVVEVMGRYAGWIALNSGISASADAILIPEIPYDIEKVSACLKKIRSEKGYAIVVVAEGAKPKDGNVFVVEKQAGRAERLGGVGEKVTSDIQYLTGIETRSVILGHLLRGGSPTTFDRLLSLRFGAAAVRALAAGENGIMVALAPPTVNYVPLEQATNRMKCVPVDSDTVMTARELGICFGE
ncbi:MAG: ATP-dependent 6-phosphofructokinase [Melioribacteraceae bacterium]|nr:ATP-dependent 6-phosphofructokinase [Melioribacteraceae bacterium]MCF8354992.1 ATP-dependent 6-phosphofructokinase [Melioribacteraceae bacterium]MCF8394317.1 ATP-dependent 6-phosphofructokinase [Melioribacteraceae bacterium]MCF8419996.1 ATP-dependent 6-phosphofructokinase [Melioribacteraceae bacterium]